MKKVFVFFMAAPCAGKTKFAELLMAFLRERFNLDVASSEMSQLLEYDFPGKLEHYKSQGRNLPDEDAIWSAEKHLLKIRDSVNGADVYLCVGWLRTPKQAREILRLYRSTGDRFVVHLDIDDEVGIERMLKRRRQANAGEIRSDDNLDVYRSRIAEYRIEEEQIRRSIDDAGVDVVTVDANTDGEEAVFGQFLDTEGGKRLLDAILQQRQVASA